MRSNFVDGRLCYLDEVRPIGTTLDALATTHRTVDVSAGWRPSFDLIPRVRYGTGAVAFPVWWVRRNDFALPNTTSVA
jgi:hypothetical protein